MGEDRGNVVVDMIVEDMKNWQSLQVGEPLVPPGEEETKQKRKSISLKQKNSPKCNSKQLNREDEKERKPRGRESKEEHNYTISLEN